MTKRYYKDLKLIGKFFCIYNTSQTANCNVFIYQGVTYFKPRYKAIKGETINGVNNLVKSRPVKIGLKTGYHEV